MSSDSSIRKYFEYDSQKTYIQCCGSLLIFNQPAYYMPIHLIGASFISLWRNQSGNCLGMAARRVVCGVALVALAIVGIVDVVVRLGLACFEFAKGSKENSMAYLKGASLGFELSLNYATCLQVRNFYEVNFVPFVNR